MGWPNCDVCDKPAMGVFASPFGPVSWAYCIDCLRAGREPYCSLVGGLSGITSLDALTPSARDRVLVSLAHEGKSVPEFLADIAANDKEYFDHLRARGSLEE